MREYGRILLFICGIYRCSVGMKLIGCVHCDLTGGFYSKCIYCRTNDCKQSSYAVRFQWKRLKH